MCWCMCGWVNWWSAEGAPEYRVRSTDYREDNKGDWLAGVWLARGCVAAKRLCIEVGTPLRGVIEASKGRGVAG